MHKVIKYFLSSVSFLIVLLLALPVALALVFNIGAVQNSLAQRAAAYASSVTGTVVSIGDIKIRGYNTLEGRELYIEDHAGDTLIYSNSLTTSISLKDMVLGKLRFTRTHMDGVKVFLFQPGDDEINITKVVDTFIDRDNPNSGDSPVLLENVSLTNAEFRYRSEREYEPVQPTMIDFQDMVLKELNVTADNLFIQGDLVAFGNLWLQFVDKSGFRVREMTSAVFNIQGSRLVFADTRICTDDSDVKMSVLNLNADVWQAYGDYNNCVPMDIKFYRTDISAKTLSHFVPWLHRDSDVLLKGISLTLNGTVNDFGGNIAWLGNSRLSASGHYAIKDITDSDNAFLTLDFSEFRTDGKETIRLLGEFQELTGLDLDEGTSALIDRIGGYNFVGKIEGKYQDLGILGDLFTSVGDASVDINLGLYPQSTTIDGNIAGRNLQAGKLLNVGLLGDINFSGDFKLDYGDRINSASAVANVESVALYNTPYNGILMNISYADNRFRGGLTSLDNDLAFKVDGELDLGGEIPMFDLDMHVNGLNLRKFGIDVRDDDDTNIRMYARMTGSGSDPDDFNGSLTIDNMEIRKRGETVVVDRISLLGINNEESKYLSFTSSIVDAEYRSVESYGDVKDFFFHLLPRYLPSLEKESTVGTETETGIEFLKKYPESNSPAGFDAWPVNSEDYNSFITVDVKQSKELESILPAGMAVADNTSLSVGFNPSSGYINASAESDYIEYGKALIIKPGMLLSNINDENKLCFSLFTEDIFTETFAMPSINVSAVLATDTVKVEANINNADTDIYANINIDSFFSRTADGKLLFSTGILPSKLYTVDRSWTVESKPVTFGKSRIEIEKFSVSCDDQEFVVSGVISDRKNDTLNFNLRNFDIALLSGLTHIEGYDISGILNGYAKVASVNNNAMLSADMALDNVGINNIAISPLHFRSLWDFSSEQILFELTNKHQSAQLVRGMFKPQSGEYKVRASIESIPIAFIEPALKGAVSGTDGELSVDVRMEGDRKRSLINGRIDVTDFSTRLAFNNVFYSVPNIGIDVRDNILDIRECFINDHEHNQARLSAHADLTSLRNVSYRAHISTERIKILETTAKDNPVYFGEVYTSGNMALTGDKMGLKVDGDLAVANRSAVTALLAGPSDVVNPDFITFRSKTSVEQPDDVVSLKKLMYERMVRNKENRQDFRVDFKTLLYVGPDTDIALLFDMAGDNKALVAGSGLFNISLFPHRNEFDIYGSYDIDYGKFIFNLQNVLVNKVFAIEPGGSIQWAGDPLDAMLNIKGVYSLKASLAPIAGTSELEKSGRVPVECAITVTDRISQPDIKFDVNVVTTDATVQNSITSLLATQEMIATQFFCLLAFNNFYPDETYGQSENIGTMGTTSIGFDYLTSHISNWISSDDLNVILRYKAHDMYNSDEIDVGLSKELLDSRLILEIEGNIDTGNNQAYSLSGNRSNISGDASITWLINSSGNLRVKGFTRTIDRFDENQGLQENGVGIYYREDFNRLSDIAERYRRRSYERRKNREEKRKAKETRTVSENQ